MPTCRSTRCGRWGHKQVNCRVVADVGNPEQDPEELEEEALIGGLGDAGDPWPLIYGIMPSHPRRRRNRTPMLTGLGPIDVEMWPVDSPESEEEIELEKEYVKMEEKDDEPEGEYVEPVEQFDLEKQGGGAARIPRPAPPFTNNGRAGSKQDGAVETPRPVPLFTMRPPRRRRSCTTRKTARPWSASTRTTSCWPRPLN